MKVEIEINGNEARFKVCAGDEDVVCTFKDIDPDILELIRRVETSICAGESEGNCTLACPPLNDEVKELIKNLQEEFAE